VIVDRRPSQAIGFRAAQAQSSAPDDRCPFSRPFPPDFGDCAAHQAMAFVPTDTMHHPLRTELTCRHLTVGYTPATAGRHYARCGLGTAPERLRWLAAITPARLEVMRALQEELDAAVTAERDALLRARATQLALPDQAAPREALEAALRRLLSTLAGFMAEQEQRFADAGLPVAPLLTLLEELCWSWAHTRPAHPRRGEAVRAPAFPPVAQAFLQPVSSAPRRELVGRAVARGQAGVEGNGGAAPEPAAAKALFDAAGLRVDRLPEGVSLHGELDARNADLLGATLEAALDGAGEQHVDASGLFFCSLSGLRALVRTAQRLRPGARLVIHGMPEQTRRAMGLVGWADALCHPVDQLVLAGVQHRLVRKVSTGAMQHDGISRPSDTYVDPQTSPHLPPLPPPPADALPLRFDAATLPAVRALVSRCAARSGLITAQVADLVMAANEVAENSLVHGGGSGTLRAWREGDTVLCEVSDDGLLDVPLAGRIAPGAGVDEARGLWLANALCDLVQLRTSPAGTTVRLHMRRRVARA
jgi:anti-anti-sigma regulatory factor/anti-sigma regulatory factor (Ser/Thr protein kinase)